MGPTGITQQELESRLWAAANSLRGPVDPSDFKAYIFPLLFFKRISDVWMEEYDQAKQEADGDVTYANLDGVAPAEMVRWTGRVAGARAMLSWTGPMSRVSK